MHVSKEIFQATLLVQRVLQFVAHEESYIDFKMSEISEEMRYVMLYYRKDENDAKACPEISEVYGENTVGERRNRE